MQEPLSPAAATGLIRTILQSGHVAVSGHAVEELRKDGLTTVDAVNVLRAGRVSQAADLVRGTWRYRVATSRITVVVAFRSEEELVVVTAWRVR